MGRAETAEPRRVITLLWSLRDLARVARRIERGVAERFAEAPAERNLEVTRKLLAVALELVGRLGSAYGDEGGTDLENLDEALRGMFSAGSGEEPLPPVPGPPDSARGGDRLVPVREGEHPIPHRHEEPSVAAVARVATLELRERLADLAGLDPREDPLETLAHASHARGAFLRGAIALERLVCAAEKLRPRLVVVQELERALAIRAAYARVARSLCAEQPDETRPPSPDCLARAAAAIGELLAGNLSLLLRIADRIALARMHRRLLAHLEPSVPAGPEAVRTWQDLRGLFEMLLLVNNRQELREHDHEAARWLLERLPPAGPARLGERERKVLDLLADRDPGLRVDGPDLDGGRAEDLRRRLRRMVRELAPPEARREELPAGF